MAEHIISSAISELRDARAAVQKILRPTSSYTNSSAIRSKVCLALSRLCLLPRLSLCSHADVRPLLPFCRRFRHAHHRLSTYQPPRPPVCPGCALALMFSFPIPLPSCAVVCGQTPLSTSGGFRSFESTTSSFSGQHSPGECIFIAPQRRARTFPAANKPPAAPPKFRADRWDHYARSHARLA